MKNKSRSKYPLFHCIANPGTIQILVLLLQALAFEQLSVICLSPLSLSPANGSNKILLSHFIFRPSLLPLTRLGATPNSTIFYPLCWSNFKTFTFFSVGKTNFLSELLSNCIEVVMFIIGTKKIKTESIT